jgi:hypothetical protein
METGVTRWIITLDRDLLASINRKYPSNMINDAVIMGNKGKQ